MGAGLPFPKVDALRARVGVRSHIAVLIRLSPHRMEVSMTDHFGSCLCCTVRFQVKGDFDRFYLCHCQHCQKDTGSAHAANLFSSSAELIWLSGADVVRSFTLPGTRHAKSFCTLCGSALPGAQSPDGVVVPAGCLDTPVPVLPTAHIFLASKAVWEEEVNDAPEFDGLPG